MKYLIFTILGLVFLISCRDSNQNNSNDDPETASVVEKLIGSWEESDNYLEHRIREGETIVSNPEKTIYHIHPDNSYECVNEMEFGLPEGKGSWSINPKYLSISFFPEDENSYNPSYKFYWKDLSFSPTSDQLKVNYYSSTYEIDSMGYIQSNRIPRVFVRE